jgi:isopenicillin-N N-acyltransferase-like protein
VNGVRVVRAKGSPLERGHQVGRGLGDLIERSLDFYHRYLERRGVGSEQLQELLAPYMSAAEHQLPGSVEVIRGMAEGAMVPVWDLFAINAFEELEPLLSLEPGRLSFLRKDAGMLPNSPAPPPPDRCSTLVVTGPGFTLLGHNEQWLDGDQGNIAVVVDAPDDGSPTIVSPTVVCCLPAVGMNELGAAQGIQSLAAADDGVGVPRVLVSRHSMDSANRVDAVRRAGLDGRAGGYGHVFGFRGGDAFIVETTATRHSLLSGPGAHTNHYLDPSLGELGPPASPGSVARYERLIGLIEDRHPEDPEAVMDIMRNHEGAPQCICLHPDHRAGDEAESVVFSMVCEVETGRMWVAPGNPCITEFEEIDLTGAIPAAVEGGS